MSSVCARWLGGESCLGSLSAQSLLREGGREGGRIYKLDASVRLKVREDAKYDPRVRVTVQQIINSKVFLKCVCLHRVRIWNRTNTVTNWSVLSVILEAHQNTVSI